MKIFIKLNRYYDNMEEPLRFLTAMTIIWLPVAISCVIAFLLSNDRIYVIFTFVWLLMLTLLRMFWVVAGKNIQKDDNRIKE